MVGKKVISWWRLTRIWIDATNWGSRQTTFCLSAGQALRMPVGRSGRSNTASRSRWSGVSGGQLATRRRAYSRSRSANGWSVGTTRSLGVVKCVLPRGGVEVDAVVGGWWSVGVGPAYSVNVDYTGECGEGGGEFGGGAVESDLHGEGLSVSTGYLWKVGRRLLQGSAGRPAESAVEPRSEVSWCEGVGPSRFGGLLAGDVRSRSLARVVVGVGEGRCDRVRCRGRRGASGVRVVRGLVGGCGEG